MAEPDGLHYGKQRAQRAARGDNDVVSGVNHCSGCGADTLGHDAVVVNQCPVNIQGYQVLCC